MLSILFLTKPGPQAPSDQTSLSPRPRPGPRREAAQGLPAACLYCPVKVGGGGRREGCCYGNWLQQTWQHQAGGTPDFLTREKETFLLTKTPEGCSVQPLAPSPTSPGQDPPPPTSPPLCSPLAHARPLFFELAPPRAGVRKNGEDEAGGISRAKGAFPCSLPFLHPAPLPIQPITAGNRSPTPQPPAC